jgi:TPR repeat protein
MPAIPQNRVDEKWGLKNVVLLTFWRPTMQWDHEASAEEVSLAEKLFEEAEFLEFELWQQKGDEQSPAFDRLIELYLKLLNMGNIDAMYAIGNLYNDDCAEWFNRKEAIAWYERATNEFHQLAMYKLAMLLMDSDQSRAYELLEIITEVIDNSNNLEFADAYYQIALMQWTGEGCDVDYTKAFANFRIAATHVHYRASLQMAKLYDKGFRSRELSIPKRPEKAAKYMENACACEPPSRFEATFSFARMLNKGKGISDDFPWAFRLFYKAAIRGCGPAMVELAKIHLADELFPVDNEMAYLWLLVSQSFNCDDYCDDRDSLKQEIVQKLSKAQKLRLQKVAKACSTIIQMYPGKKHLSAHILSAEDYLHKNSYLDQAELVSELEKQPEPETEDDAHEDEKAFKGVEAIKNDFDRDKVSFRIWIDRPIKAGAPLDFGTLKVKYEGQNLQIKNMDIYANKSDKVSPKTRNLLFRLAVAQFLHKEDTLVKQIIDQAPADLISRINRLFNLIFPYCWQTNSPVIDRGKGKILIKLEIHSPGDKSVSGLIQNAGDYEDLGVR